MDRRKFIQLLTSSGVGLYTMDLDKLLWVPGEKTIFIPPPKRLIFASDIVLAEWEKVMRTVGDIFQSDKLLFSVVSDKSAYKADTGDYYKTVQIFHGYEEKK